MFVRWISILHKAKEYRYSILIGWQIFILGNRTYRRSLTSNRSLITTRSSHLLVWRRDTESTCEGKQGLKQYFVSPVPSVKWIWFTMVLWMRQIGSHENTPASYHLSITTLYLCKQMIGVIIKIAFGTYRPIILTTIITLCKVSTFTTIR